MFIVGALYLIFEKDILAESESRSTADSTTSHNSRLILSTQVSHHLLDLISVLNIPSLVSCSYP